MIITDEIYGTFEVEGILEAIVQSQPFQRLSRIHQGGALFLINPQLNHTRYEHSIGVMWLIRYLGGSEKAQVAGLLHDVSHTAFSHLVDYVLENEREDYHEQLYEQQLHHPALKDIFKQYGYVVKDFLILEDYPVLESDLPNFSTDRIDYTLRDLFRIQKIDKSEIEWFLQGLTIEGGNVVAKGIEYAKWFREKYQYLNEAYFNAPKHKYAQTVMTTVLKMALQEQIITLEDFEEDDFYLLDKMRQADHPIIEEALASLATKTEVLYQKQPVSFKKRIIDPEVLVGDQLYRLSSVEP